MKSGSGNSDWHRVTLPAANDFLANRALRRLLVPFLEQACSVGVAAEKLGLTTTAMYKKVQTMLELGLLEVKHSTSRAGKAVKHYQAVAQHFFIPFREYPAELVLAGNQPLYAEHFAKALRRLYREQYFAELDWGACTRLAPSGDCFLEIMTGDGKAWDYLALEAPAIAVGWNPMWLDFADAKALQRELVALLKKYMGKNGSSLYLTGVFLSEAQQELGLSPPNDTE